MLYDNLLKVQLMCDFIPTSTCWHYHSNRAKNVEMRTFAKVFYYGNI